MKKRSIIIIVILLLIAIGGFIYFNHSKKTTTNEQLGKDEYKLTTKTDEYIAKNDEGTIIAKNKITNVTIKNSAKKDQASIIEESINEIMKEYWDKANEQADEMLESGFYDATIENLDFGVTIKASEYAKNEKTYIIEVTEVGAFGGNEWNSKYLYNYNPNTGDLLSLKDITNDYETFKKAVIKSVKEHLNKEYNKDDLFLSDISDNKLFDIIKQDGNWALTNEGLVIIFQKNDIAPASTGIIEVNIEIDNIKEYLNDTYK